MGCSSPARWWAHGRAGRNRPDCSSLPWDRSRSQNAVRAGHHCPTDYPTAGDAPDDAAVGAAVRPHAHHHLPRGARLRELPGAWAALHRRDGGRTAGRDGIDRTAHHCPGTDQDRKTQYVLATIVLQIIPLLAMLLTTQLWAPLFDRMHITTYRVVHGCVSFLAHGLLFTGAMVGARQGGTESTGLLIIALGQIKIAKRSTCWPPLSYRLSHCWRCS